METELPSEKEANLCTALLNGSACAFDIMSLCAKTYRSICDMVYICPCSKCQYFDPGVT